VRRPAGSDILVAVSPVQPSPPLSCHAGHCGNIPALLGRAGTRHRHNGHCATYGLPVNGTLELAHHSGQSTNRYAAAPRSRSCAGTGRTTTPQQERDSPGRSSAPQRCSPYLYT
jgi:hypothetical protein